PDRVPRAPAPLSGHSGGGRGRRSASVLPPRRQRRSPYANRLQENPMSKTTDERPTKAPAKRESRRRRRHHPKRRGGREPWPAARPGPPQPRAGRGAGRRVRRPPRPEPHGQRGPHGRNEPFERDPRGDGARAGAGP